MFATTLKRARFGSFKQDCWTTVISPSNKLYLVWQTTCQRGISKKNKLKYEKTKNFRSLSTAEALNWLQGLEFDIPFLRRFIFYPSFFGTFWTLTKNYLSKKVVHQNSKVSVLNLSTRSISISSQGSMG